MSRILFDSFDSVSPPAPPVPPTPSLGTLFGMGTRPVVTDYPRSVLEGQAALKFGTFTHGWLCNELSGNLIPVFGPDTLVASGTGLFYGYPGPGGSPGPGGVDDFAIGFSPGAATGRFSGNAALFDIASVDDDLIVAWVGKWSALPSVYGAMFGKATPAFGNGWHMAGQDGTSLVFDLGPSASWSASLPGTSGYMVGRWHVGIAVIDRTGVDTTRFGVRDLFGGTTVLSTTSTGINGNTAISTSNFTVGRGDWVPGNDNFRLAALYAGKGPGVAAGLGVTANITTALQNFTAYITRVDSYKAKVMRNMLPPPYKRNFGAVVPNILTVIGQSDNLIGGLFGAADFLPDEG